MLLAVVCASANAMKKIQKPTTPFVARKTFYFERKKEENATTLFCKEENDNVTYMLEISEFGEYASKKSPEDKFPTASVPPKLYGLMKRVEGKLKKQNCNHAIVRINPENKNEEIVPFVTKEKETSS